MGVVGFIDDRGERIRFDNLDAGTFSLPHPVLRMFASQFRGSDHYGSADVISVTTLAQPVQAVRLIERHELFVDPLSHMWAAFGTLGHAMFEGHTSDDDISERRLVIDFEGQLVGGTFDLLETVGGELIGRDYKITNAYKVSLMQSEGAVKAALDYVMQANVYRYMLSQPDAREVSEVMKDEKVRRHEWQPFEHAGIGERIDRWQLVAWSRDWTAKQYAGKLKPIEIVDIPLISSERVENYLRQRIALYAAAGMCDDAGLPECTRDETWGGKRCASWCDAAPHCQQLKRGRK